MFISLFKRQIAIRPRYCAKDNFKIGSKVEAPYVNLYVQVTSRCNMRCKFCCAKNNLKCHFDINSFKVVVNEILGVAELRKISFTGGEPTLYVNLLNELAEFIKGVSPNTFIVVNSNGFAINKINHEAFDSIALSRHHYNDKQNNELFLGKPISSLNIKDLSFKGKIHLSCNIIKGYIDNSEEIVRYLEHAIDIGVDDVGFVTLMNIEGFSSKNRVTFKDTGALEDERFYKTRSWRGGSCECFNFLYLSGDERYIRFYARQVLNVARAENSNLIFDGTSLKRGFQGPIVWNNNGG